jgi:uncharacterized protein YabN with tetrapyrrole methylase and pyrophosphatase domain
VPDPLKAFLVGLALDPDALGRFIADPDACLAAGLSSEDHEVLTGARADRLMARLSLVPPEPSGKDAERRADATPTMGVGAGSLPGSLVVVGTGIRSVGQLTIEAIARIKYADRVFYLVAEPVAQETIRTLNPAGCRSLAGLYREGKPRRETYREMVDEILASVRSGARTCAVFYGHPGVFVDPAHAAIRQARAEGFQAEMLPGVSAEDCLFADLGIDPATAGCQSYEATDFLVNHRQIDSTSHVVLWQVGVLGDRTFSLTVRESTPLGLLRERLARTYPRSHQICAYEAAVLPCCAPSIRWLALDALDQTSLSIVSTLYIPPSAPPRIDLELYFAVTGAG